MPRPEQLRPTSHRIEVVRSHGQEQETRFNSDHSYYLAHRFLNATGAATVVGRPYRRTNAQTNNPQISALAELTGVYQDIVVAVEAVPAGGWCLCAVYGEVDAAVDGTTDVAQGDLLRPHPSSSTVALVREATANVKTAATVATARAAQAANSPVVVRVHLHGDRVTMDQAVAPASFLLIYRFENSPGLLVNQGTKGSSLNLVENSICTG